MDFNNTATTDLTRKDIDFVADRDSGKVWILHGKPFLSQKTLESAAFNPQTGLITLIAADGARQTVNIPIKPPIAESFATATIVTVLWTDKGEIFDAHILPLAPDFSSVTD
ncbi:MAG: hypothetical protein KJ667_07530 [Alphaproteobacteria bacterium]|nr:hypothetical protein [Alphaproteobacteria bacterium]